VWNDIGAERKWVRKEKRREMTRERNTIFNLTKFCP